MFSDLFIDLVQLIIKEIKEDTKILKEILNFHGGSLIQSLSTNRQKRNLIKKMKRTTNYKQWKTLALSFDKLPGFFFHFFFILYFSFISDIKFYKENIFSRLYDYEYIQRLRNDLIEAQSNKNPYVLIRLLREHTFRNIAGILNPELYNRCYFGTKKLIIETQNLLISSYKFIQELPKEKLTLQEKIEFFSESRHAFGKTALCLSGGAIMGLYHFGVIKTLYEQNLMPRVVTGSSAGSLVACLLCSRKYEEIIDVNFTNETSILTLYFL